MLMINSLFLSSSSSSPPLLLNHTKSPSIPITTSNLSISNPATAISTPLRWTPQTLQFRVSSSSANRTVEVASPPGTDGDESADVVESGADVVRKFYGGVNRQDLGSVEGLIAEKCVYEDLVFPRPFVGRKDILQFFKKFNDSVGKDLQFVIDDLSAEDSTAVGVTWHLEWNGKPFPFSKGCSFYKLEVIDGKRQIIYGRDSVEPAIKPGETVLIAIRGVAWLLRQFPQLIDQI
ncbi:hypothetical protein D8674_033407 [Pyrus ussuriensis x Pyrus communis]|uniref:SnoaL-like domain-containing protein n=1 Tax=Pyrus ussuriensis x Pyrus communis TaxID=2448454 RepID=A0A5N5HR50_9ROSA|nr:hypothetical protein D8674_033407 [Pyrus ussuriensis x Pyrus communis]